ncbi:SDR family NAD(P)-dependent oxidoreductase [Egicoccus sp. AB-alg2]|uniref:SDR family NAD(P)-dependent oxidoreductase n=1 Tax=Egicoccus sp. AB-alg2 TaxID=3242693 RepID=UPI00359E3159
MRDTPLQGRTVLITGGSRGLGAATARRVAALGARVVITYRERAQDAAAVVAACEARTRGARAEQLDLREEDSVRDLFSRLEARGDDLDVVIANAAATAFKPLLEVKPHQLDKTFAISVRHFLLTVQLAFPFLQRRGGRVVAVSGADTVGYLPGHGLLAAAKASMETMVRYLGCELGPHGVTAVGVLPGYVDTASIRMMAGPYHDKLVAAEERTHPLRTAASPDDAAEVIAMLCRDEARWLNGQIVQNDGGGLFAALGRFGQAWAMVPDDAAPPDASDAPMLRE